MRKIVAAINMTLDGYCDHTSITPDDDLHQHYADLINDSDIILYGRKTFHLMKYWQTLVENPSGKNAMDEFAVVMDKIPKIVFSTTLNSTDWKSARLAQRNLKDEVAGLKQQLGRSILVGSRSLILQLMKLNLIDEYQFCVHPVVAGSGLLLFENTDSRHEFKLINTKIFTSGAVVFYYEPTAK